jgi:hypothetical protein
MRARSCPATETLRRTFQMSGEARCQMSGEARRGTSLMEVLAAILVMSVGVLSVMTLFPISIIRSIQATNLTNATILSKRADAIIDMYGLVTDTYIPQPAEGYQVHAVIDPLGWHDMVDADPGFGAIAQEYGNDGSGGVVRYSPLSPPVFNNDQFQGGPPKYVDHDGGNPPRVPLRRISYAVNPINPGPVPVFPTPFPPAVTAVQFPIFPMPGSPTNRDSVLAAVGLPDSFNSVFEGEPDATNGTPPTAIAFNAAQVDLSYAETHAAGHPGSSNPNQEVKLVPGSRVVLIDGTGRRSQVRDVTYDNMGVPNGIAVYPTGTEWIIEWANPLPANFATVAEARLEIPQSRYTWMLTVRKRGTTGGSVTEIDCVTFFNRQTGDPAQERVHAAFAPNVAVEPDPANPTYRGMYNPERIPPSDLLTIDYNGIEAPVKRGGFLFDPTNCLWYRVLNILLETPTYVAVQLERDAESATPIRSVIVPEGVINVFPLTSRVDQSRLDQARRVGPGGGAGGGGGR